MSKNLRALSARHGLESPLIASLGEAAREDDGLTAAKLRRLAQARLLSPAAVLGAASFYDFLKPLGKPERAHVCSGTACLMAGRQGEARSRLEREFPADKIGAVACLGHCYRGGGHRIDGRDFDAGHLDAPDHAEDAIPYACAAPRSIFGGVAEAPEPLYAAASREAAALLAEIEASGLRGRGGAAFPFARKLRACAEAAGEVKYVVCNGDEGDPGAFSDRWLMEERPHRVLAGMFAAGRAAGAMEGVVYLRAEYPRAAQRMARAIEEFHALPLARGFRFHLVQGAGSYVCGEETALLNSIEGLRPEVRIRPPYPAQSGLFDRPTLVSNVETFACLPWILAEGGAAFAALGTAQSAGHKLVCLDSGFRRPGVYEVEMGLPLERLLQELGGGFRVPMKALQVGGPLGGVVPIASVGKLTVDYESFTGAGHLLGHASVVAIPADFPMLEFLRHLFRFCAAESCGKCYPCRLGTRRGQDMLEAADATQPMDADAFLDLLETLEAGSLCALGGGLPLPVRNVLDHFAEELRPVLGAGGER